MKKTSGVKGVKLLTIRIEAVEPLFSNVSGAVLPYHYLFSMEEEPY